METLASASRRSAPLTAVLLIAACGTRAPIADCFGEDCTRAAGSVPARMAESPCTRNSTQLPLQTPESDGAAPRGLQYDGPPIGAIRWDAWTNDPTLPWWSNCGLSSTVPSGSKYNRRKPLLWDDFQLYGPCVDTQAIVDAEIVAARGKLDFWLFDWYPPRELLDPSDQVPQCDIQLAFDAYKRSARKGDIKFALLLQYYWMMHPSQGGAYFQAYCDWIAKQVRDPQYLRIDGKSLLVLYNDRGNGGWKGNPEKWTQLKDTIGEPVYGVSVNSIEMLQTLGLQANILYGPNGAGHSGTGRRAYAAQSAIDASHDGAVPRAERVSSRTAINDHRPLARNGLESTTWWVDQPTQHEWYSAIRTAIAPTQKLAIIYSWNEVSEGGPGIVPTFQEGSRYLDAIGWVRNQEAPTAYTYPLDFAWLYVTSNGTWTESSPDAPYAIDAHDGDEVLSATPGDYKEFTHPALQEVHIHATVGPDRGIMDITRDSAITQTIDLYSASTSISSDVATVTFSDPPASHTIRVTVRGEKNPASSSVQVGLDYADVTYNPAAAADPRD